MFGGLAKTLFGSSNDRYVKSLGAIVTKINDFEPTISAMSDEDLSAQTVRFRERLAADEKLDDLLPEAFATVREAAKRALGQRHYDVQMIGGVVLHRGERSRRWAPVRERRSSPLFAVYLNALSGQGSSRGDGERLPGTPAMPRMDGAGLYEFPWA